MSDLSTLAQAISFLEEQGLDGRQVRKLVDEVSHLQVPDGARRIQELININYQSAYSLAAAIYGEVGGPPRKRSALLIVLGLAALSSPLAIRQFETGPTALAMIAGAILAGGWLIWRGVFPR